jgi:hypothetical protein
MIELGLLGSKEQKQQGYFSLHMIFFGQQQQVSNTCFGLGL